MRGKNVDQFWKIKAVPVVEDAEVLNGLTKYSWFGTTKLFLEGKAVGVGITEVFKF